MTAMKQSMAVLTSHVTAEWYTPPWLIELVRDVLGEIELDPASDEMPERWIKAVTWWNSGGLKMPWTAKTVFCNPPYGNQPHGKSNQALWSAKMIAEYRAGRFDEGVLLINSTHGYRWYEELWTAAVCCLLRERVKFVAADGTVGAAAKRGQTLVYFGGNAALFETVFAPYGRVLR